MIHEKRKYIRFKAQKKVYVALGTHFSKAGKLRDISMDGLSFQYIESTKADKLDSSVIAIFHSEDMFYLPNLACTIIDDQPICANGQISAFRPMYLMKRCSVRFRNITAHQREKLEFIINNYTCGLVPFLNELMTRL